MKRAVLTIAFFAPIFIHAQSFTVSNAANVGRTDELVVLTRAFISEKGLSIGKNYAVKTPDGTHIPLQFDDLDQDGRWDEAVFLYSFAPAQTVDFTITPTEASAVHSWKRAHVRLRRKTSDAKYGKPLPRETMPLLNPPTDFSKQPLPLYLTEGPAWENDKVAFRLYFDTRNNRDIFGKTTAKPVMDTVGANPALSYHRLSDWGMDILKTGNSIGAGSIAIRTADGITRLGGNTIKKTEFAQIADGPVRAIFTLTHDCGIGQIRFTIRERISIWGGQYFYQDDIDIDPSESLQLFTGMPDFYKAGIGSLRKGSATALHSFGRQSENGDALGMAVITTGASDAIYREMDSALIELTHTSYRFYACWERTAADFAFRQHFTDFIASETEKMAEPLRIGWK